MATTVLTQHTLGAPYNGTTHNNNLQTIEDSLTDLGPFVVSGLVPSAGAGLTASISSGVAFIGGRVTKAASFNITGLTDATLNHLYLLNTGSGTSNTTGTQPANSVKLGTATTAGGVVTAVDVTPAGGRQTKTFILNHQKSVKTVSTNYTATASDYFIGVDTTAGNVTITLPTAANAVGQAYVVKKVAGGNNAVIDGNGAETIDGAATQTISTLWASLTVRSTGTTWWVE